MSNEPLTGGLYTTTTYPPAWNAYYSSITGTIPSAKFAACDDNNQGLSQTAIGSLTPGIAGLSAATIHYYSGAANTGINDWPALLSALQPANFSSIQTFAAGTPLVMSETNSLSFGGQVGVSDRLMAQAWFINFAAKLAKGGWAGICPHSTYSYNGGQGVYNPIVKNANGSFSPSPIFYGMYLLSKIAGKQMAASTQGGTAYTTSIAAKEADGNASVVVCNNENSNVAFIRPMQSAAWTTATVLISQSGDGLGPTSSMMSLGGQPIGAGGSWSGAPFTINNGDSFALQPCGAAYVKFNT